MKPVHQCKALILDQEPVFEPILKAMMAGLKWDCEFVASGDAAVAGLKAGRFDVLIVDYQMRPSNGLHFICRLRQEGIMVPAILMSNDPQTLRLTPQEMLSIPAVLLKPFTAVDLNYALWTALAE
jgi:CheY-like chemotaxis protein